MASDLVRRKDVLALVIGGGEFAFIPADKIKAIPAVDAVEVVRCKDCKEGDFPEEEGGVMMYLCPRAGKRVRSEFFCADGTPRRM